VLGSLLSSALGPASANTWIRSSFSFGRSTHSHNQTGFQPVQVAQCGPHNKCTEKYRSDWPKHKLGQFFGEPIVIVHKSLTLKPDENAKIGQKDQIQPIAAIVITVYGAVSMLDQTEFRPVQVARCGPHNDTNTQLSQPLVITNSPR